MGKIKKSTTFCPVFAARLKALKEDLFFFKGKKRKWREEGVREERKREKGTVGKGNL